MPSLQYKCFDELLSKANMVDLSKRPMNIIYKSVSSGDICKKAKEFWSKEDFENCFIFAMRYLEMLSYLQKKPNFDKSELPSMNRDFAEMVQTAENAKSKLEVLYEQKESTTRAAAETVKGDVLLENETVPAGISCTYVFNEVKKCENENRFLIMDVRSELEFRESRINREQFDVDVMNVPDTIIESGKSAKFVENNLSEEYLPLWKVRQTYKRIFTMDVDGLPGGKATILRNILLNFDSVEFDGNIHFLLGGFNAWSDCYPWTVINPVPKDSFTTPSTVFNLDNIEFNLDFDLHESKPNFDRTKKPSSIKSSIPAVDRSAKAAALKTYARTDLLKEKEQELKGMLEIEKKRWQSEMNLQNELRRQKEAQCDEERQNILIEAEEKLLREIAKLKTSTLMKDEKIKELENMIERSAVNQKSIEDVDIEKNIDKHEEEARGMKKRNDDLENERMKQEARSRPKPSPQIRPEINRSTKPKIDEVPIIGQSPGLTGLKNLGNTCYMNSILQCISNNPLLAEYFIHQKYQKDLNKNHKTQGQVAENVAGVVRTLWSGRRVAYACTDFKKTVGAIKSEYRTCEQQDSHEFLTFLMDWLHNDLKKEAGTADRKQKRSEMEKAWENLIGRSHSFISEKFYGLQKSTVSCSRCDEQSATYEPFSNLSLNLPDGDHLYLSTCLELYLITESISGWRCPKCKDQRQAEKKTEFCRLPDILVIHLKRFSFLDIHSKKKTALVEFPLDELNLDSDDERRTYSLYGVSNHYGTMEGGHYTAYCKHPLFKRWFKFDDHEVTQIAPRDVVTNAAYILFYKAVYD